MNEEIEYAEMLEIPVSTVNVVKKKQAKKKKRATVVAETLRREYSSAVSNPSVRSSDLKESVIAQVNDKLVAGDPSPEHITAEADLFAEGANSEGSLDFSSDIPDRIDTVRLYSENERPFSVNNDSDYGLPDEDYENEEGRYALNREKAPSKTFRILLGAEFATACALCGAIFLTNVFMPESAINTFFRSLDGGKTVEQEDVRTYTDFTLSNVVSELSDAELTISPTGILSFTEKCHVYPAADGKVSEITQNADGTYQLKISHSESFTGVIGGLDSVYYAVGDEVKANVPVGYSDGETEVQVTMYSSGELLNCFYLTEENCLAWVEQDRAAE